MSAVENGPETIPASIMKLRDWFAGQALVGLLAHHGPIPNMGPSPIATAVYEMADAMLVARSESHE